MDFLISTPIQRIISESIGSGGSVCILAAGPPGYQVLVRFEEDLEYLMIFLTISSGLKGKGI